MKNLGKLSTVGLVLANVGCSSELRDAAVGGVLDFITGTITESITAALPVADCNFGCITA